MNLQYNVAMDAGSLAGLIIDAFRWIFFHGDGVFCPIGDGQYVILCS